jgi:hypothetical protein
MKRLLIAVAMVAISAVGCTVDTSDILNTDKLIGKLGVDKDTQQAIAASMMKQLNQAAAAITPAVEKPAAAPRTVRLEMYRPRKTPFVSLAVTADQCMKTGELVCTADGSKCEYTEDYTACGKDYGGKIKRTFTGDYAKYRIDIDFDHYSEKATTDAGHFGFHGTSSLSGSVVGDVSLQMHQDGEQELVAAETLFTLKSSATFTIAALNNQTILDGTQTGKVVQTGQTESISYTKITLDPSCASGPVAGKMVVTVDDKEAVTEITGCGKGTVTINGEATPLTDADLKATFLPGDEATGDSGLADLGNATDPGSLVLGDWFADSGTIWGSLSLYPGVDGTDTLISFSIQRDNDASGTFDSDGDTYEYGYGTVVFGNGDATVTFEYYEAGTYSHGTPNVDTSLTPRTYTFVIEGNGALTFDGVSFTKYADVTPPQTVDNPMNGYWIDQASDVTGTTRYVSVYLYDDLLGFTMIQYDAHHDTSSDGYLFGIGDTEDWFTGTFTNGGTAITPAWDLKELYTFVDDGAGNPTYGTPEVLYDSSLNGNVPQSDSPWAFVLDDKGNTDPYDDTLTLNNTVYSRW